MSYIFIVIVNYNTRELLDRCLESIFSGSLSLEKSVIVVDNNSEDGSKELITQKWPQVKLISNSDNRGYAPACNQGLKISDANYVMAINTDAFLVGDSLAEMVSFMEENPDVCAVGPKQVRENGELVPQCARRRPTLLSLFIYYSGLGWRLQFLNSFSRRILPLEHYDSVQDVEILCGACIVFRRSALEKVGLLDDRLILNFDDIEWCERAARHNCRIVYLPKARVIHLGGQSGMAEISRGLQENIRSSFRYFDISFRWPSSLLLKLTIVGGIAWSLAKDSVLAPFSRQRRSLLPARSRLFLSSLRMIYNP